MRFIKEEKMKEQEIRAEYDRDTITVYQAYNKQIALPALQHQRFQAPFSFNRMTWIKPSYLWLMERSNWANKSNQEYILAIKIKRTGWEKALSLAVVTDPDKRIYTNAGEWHALFEKAKVHVQWDPERTLKGAKLREGSIQVGISRYLIEEFNNEWIVEITDMTPLTKKIYALKRAGKFKEAKRLLPKERVYPISDEIARKIGVR